MNADPSSAYLSEPLINTSAAAAWLGISRHLLAVWRCKGYGPRYHQAEGSATVLYRISDLEAWVAEAARLPPKTHTPKSRRPWTAPPVAEVTGLVGHDTVLHALHDYIRACGGAAEVARRTGVAREYISLMRTGRHAISTKVAAHLGYRAVTAFEPLPAADRPDTAILPVRRRFGRVPMSLPEVLAKQAARRASG